MIVTDTLWYASFRIHLLILEMQLRGIEGVIEVSMFEELTTFKSASNVRIRLTGCEKLFEMFC